MAFNWQTFRTRALSAVVFVAIMAVGLFWNEWTFLLLFTLVHFGCWIEYYKLLRAIRPVDENAGRLVGWLFTLIGWCLMLYLAGLPEGASFPLSVLEDVRRGMLWTSLFILLFAGIYHLKKLSWSFVIALLGGLLYISLSLGLLSNLRLRNDYAVPAHALAIPLLVILNNWINDTMAYIVGSLIGRRPLSPISPKKTWEGTIGGVVLAVGAISLIAFLTGLLPVHHAAALSAIGAISGTYGDLAESKLKRMAGVKDSGTMMPGHGGFLDRFDSLLFSATACAIYVALAMQG